VVGRPSPASEHHPSNRRALLLAALGMLSLVFWSLILVVTVKHVLLVLHADNRGKGGVLALATLAARTVPDRPALRGLVLALTLAGLALFYGDGLITPAISVLAAVEGLQTLTPVLRPCVVLCCSKSAEGPHAIALRAGQPGLACSAALGYDPLN
jgi:K+ transporter